MDAFDWNENIPAPPVAEGNALPTINDEPIVVVNEWDSVASEVQDQFQKLAVAEREFRFGEAKMTAGEFVISLLKSNSLGNVMVLAKHVLSHHKTLEGATTMDKDHQFHYVDERARVRVRKVGELDIPNASPGQISDFCGNGRILIKDDAIHTTVFSASFILGNVLSSPSPVVTNSNRRLKTISPDSLVLIGEAKIPHSNLAYLWSVHAKKATAQGKAGNRNVADIPWVAVGETPKVVREALLTLFGDLSAACKEFKDDTIKDVPGYMFAAAWVSGLLKKENKHRGEKGSLTVVLTHLRSFYATWNPVPGVNEFGSLSTLATQAGKILAQCRDVRGKDNPGLEYSPWTVLPHLPWAFLGAARHRMILNGVKFKPSVVLHHTDSLAMFPNAKVVSGKVSGWESTFAATDAIFIVGEDVYANDMYGITHTKNKIIEELAGLAILKYLVDIKGHQGRVALRMLLPKSSATFEEFVRVVTSLRPKGGLMLIPSVTPHNLEVYLIFDPAYKNQTDSDFALIVLARLYHSYMTSICVNWARTVCYCLLIPGNVGASLFYGPFVKQWLGCVYATLDRDFYIDTNSKLDIYRRVTFEAVDERMYELPPTKREEKRAKTDKDQGSIGVAEFVPKADVLMGEVKKKRRDDENVHE
jgi:hypothetical protein